VQIPPESPCLKGDTDVLKSCKNMHVPLDGKIDGVDLLEEVEMLRNITPENDRKYNSLKCIINNNFTGPYLNVFIAYRYS
jgi:hypothetical protein